MKINYDAMNEIETFVPHHMREGFRLYFEYGYLPGSYGEAILCNDLKGAVGRADHINQRHIASTVAWFYNYAPTQSWGSVEKVRDWIGSRTRSTVAE